MNAKCYWIASMPRSGSMWAFNVTRELFRVTGHQVRPAHIPRRSPDMLAYADEAQTETEDGTVWILKTHDSAQSRLPGCRFIASHRDLRDALISFMNFVQCGFDQAIQAMCAAAQTSDAYRALGAERVLNLDYTAITGAPLETVQRIAAYCELDPGAVSLNDIAARFDKAAVGRLIAETESDVVSRLRNSAAVDDNEIVPLANGQTRVMHLATGFQGGHVTDYRDGDWRRILTAEQKATVRAALGDWLDRNGYPP